MCDRFPSVVSKLPLQKGDEPSGSSFVRALNPKSDHWNGFVRTFTPFTKEFVARLLVVSAKSEQVLGRRVSNRREE
jgi:hypothetical protein